MGGEASKFDDTDWVHADGGLLKNNNTNKDLDKGDEDTAGATLDGSPPTLTFQKCELVKKNFTTQREFDIFNGQHELVYTTRAIPGTLAWFDLLGRKEEQLVVDDEGESEDPSTRSHSSQEESEDNDAGWEFLLRVQVDLTRRTWTVYRYQTPIFEGQKPATLAARTGFNSVLYKTACITVSWSRYTAVAARYGPPSLHHFLKAEEEDADEVNEEEETESDHDDDEVFHSRLQPTASADSQDEDNWLAKAQQIAARRRAETIPEEQEATVESQTSSTSFSSDKAKKLLKKAAASCGNCNKPADHNNSPESSLHAPSDFDALAQHYQKSVSNMLFGGDDKPRTREQKRQAAYEEALEGVIDLDNERSLLQCQEIYNKFFGHHQTSLVNKAQVLTLLQLDDVQHKPQDKHNGNDPTDENPLVHAGVKEQNEKDRSSLERQTQPSSWNLFGYNKNNSSSAEPHDEIPMPLNEMDADLRAIMEKKRRGEKASKGGEWAAASDDETSDPINEMDADLQAIMEKKRQEEKSPKGGGWTASDDDISDPKNEMDADLQAIMEKKRQGEKSSKGGGWFDYFGTPKKKENKGEDDRSNEGGVTVDTGDGSMTPEEDDSKDHSQNKEQESEIAKTSSSPDELFHENGDDGSAVVPLASMEKESKEDDYEPTTTPTKAAVNNGDVPTTETAHTGEQDTVGQPVDHTQLSDTQEPLLGKADGEDDSRTTYDEKPGEPPAVPQPLVGYWAWKNTYAVQKVEMHLAKNSDLALHTILAIIVNQVRYERNALAMTV